MIWFIADTHFGHTNIINYCGRPFATHEEMNETIIQNWNACVQKNDIVYHLGDFGFGDIYKLHKIAQRLKGQINLILGNHDNRRIKEPLVNRFGFVKDVHYLKAKVKGHTQKIFLSHYAHRVWPQWNYGTWHLYGHSHNNLPPLGRSMDVGVDCWNFQPISIDFVYDIMSKITIESGEDHRFVKVLDTEEESNESEI